MRNTLGRRTSGRTKLTVAIALVATATTAGWLVAADHLDAPLIQNDAAADVADVYVFTSPQRSDHAVLVMTLHGFIPPADAGTSIFDPDVLYQFKIDNDGDAVEDIVIQSFVTGTTGQQIMHVRGPVQPSQVGNTTQIVPGSDAVKVPVSTTASPIIVTGNNMTAFAGVRDDPFFFDAGQFNAIISGNATGFNNPGFDSFAGFNVYAITLEIPVSMLGGTTSKLGVWGTTSRRN